MSTQPVPHLTFDQYLEIERAAEFRNEYLHGQMYAMAGASRNHGRIVASVMASLWEQLRGRDCEAASNDCESTAPPPGLAFTRILWLRAALTDFMTNCTTLWWTQRQLSKCFRPPQGTSTAAKNFAIAAHCYHSRSIFCWHRTRLAPNTTPASRTVPGCFASSPIPAM